MMGTIVIGTCVSVQGDIVNRLPDGRISVMVGSQLFTGRAANPGDAASLRPVPRKDIRSVA